MKDVVFVFLDNIYGLPFPEFQKTSNSNNNEFLLLLFDGLWKVKAKYIVLCLNASAKLQNVRGASCPPALIGNWLDLKPHVLALSIQWMVCY